MTSSSSRAELSRRSAAENVDVDKEGATGEDVLGTVALAAREPPGRAARADRAMHHTDRGDSRRAGESASGRRDRRGADLPAQGRHPGRSSDDDILLFHSMGLGIQDAAAAWAAYQGALEAGIGTTVAF